MRASDEMDMEPQWDIYKFKDDDGQIARASRAGVDVRELKPYAHEMVRGNCTLNEGRQLLVDLIAGTGAGDPWDAAHAHIGVGDGLDPAEPTQTGLMGANKAFAPMDEGYPQRTGDGCVWRGTFGPEAALFAWNEGAVSNGPDDTAVCLNRKVQHRNMKFEGETWVMTLGIKFRPSESAPVMEGA